MTFAFEKKRMAEIFSLNGDHKVGRALLRLVGVGAAPYALFCMLLPCDAMMFMTKAEETGLSCDDQVALGMTSWLGFFFAAAMCAFIWVSYQETGIKSFLRIFGIALIIDGAWVKLAVMHRGGAFKFEHSLLAGVCDISLGLALLFSSAVGGYATKRKSA